eukprot:COSAG06_NODE_5511_length_3435_cov_2.062350_4_plen_36_part_00
MQCTGAANAANAAGPTTAANAAANAAPFLLPLFVL